MKPIITIDGPSGVGKGTLALRLAKELGWDFLDSGAIYRSFALYAITKNISLEDELKLSILAESFPLAFKVEAHTLMIILGEKDITTEVRLESTGNAASIVAKHPLVRVALLSRQRDFASDKGLVADGRDMGTVVFPEASLKFYLVASSQVRAQRRYEQLLEQNICAKIDRIFLEIEERDVRDSSRVASPLKPAHDAIVIDTSSLTPDEVYQKVRQWAVQKEFLS